MIRASDTRRMVKTGTGFMRSTGSAVASAMRPIIVGDAHA
jgi:hypothetical protein